MDINEKIEQAEKLLTDLRAELQAQPEQTWPQVGDTYWCVSRGRCCDTIWGNSRSDNIERNRGNVFRTRDKAEAALRQICNSHKQWAAQRKVLAELKERVQGLEKEVRSTEAQARKFAEEIGRLGQQVQQLKGLLHTASGSDYKWPESFKVQVNAALATHK